MLAVSNPPSTLHSSNFEITWASLTCIPLSSITITTSISHNNNNNNNNSNNNSNSNNSNNNNNNNFIILKRSVFILYCTTYSMLIKDTHP